jgi:hypothetical protein
MLIVAIGGLALLTLVGIGPAATGAR